MISNRGALQGGLGTASRTTGRQTNRRAHASPYPGRDDPRLTQASCFVHLQRVLLVLTYLSGATTHARLLRDRHTCPPKRVWTDCFCPVNKPDQSDANGCPSHAVPCRVRRFLCHSEQRLSCSARLGTTTKGDNLQPARRWRPGSCFCPSVLMPDEIIQIHRHLGRHRLNHGTAYMVQPLRQHRFDNYNPAGREGWRHQPSKRVAVSLQYKYAHVPPTSQACKTGKVRMHGGDYCAAAARQRSTFECIYWPGTRSPCLGSASPTGRPSRTCHPIDQTNDGGTQPSVRLGPRCYAFCKSLGQSTCPRLHSHAIHVVSSERCRVAAQGRTGR